MLVVRVLVRVGDRWGMRRPPVPYAHGQVKESMYALAKGVEGRLRASQRSKRMRLRKNWRGTVAEVFDDGCEEILEGWRWA